MSVRLQVIQAMQTDLKELRAKLHALETKRFRTSKDEAAMSQLERDINRAQRRLFTYMERGFITDRPVQRVREEQPRRVPKPKDGFALLAGRRDFATLKEWG